MGKLWKNHETVFEKVVKYFKECDNTCEAFKKVFPDLVNRSEGVDFFAEVEAVHTAEHAADEKRREIILELYKKGLVPGSREDILNILSAFDDIPNTFRFISMDIYIKNTEFPQPLKDKFIDLVGTNIEAFHLVEDSAMCLFKESELMDKCVLVRKKESESDRKESDLIKNIYTLDIDLSHKILLEHIVREIGGISDRAEIVAQYIELAIIKRRV